MKKEKILIVGDKTAATDELKSSLNHLGYQITSVVNTREAAIKKAESDNPDLMLMDTQLNDDTDCIETATIIRSRFGISVVFLIDDSDESMVARAKVTTPVGYILKPVQERALKVIIEMALYSAEADADRRRAEEELRENEKKFKNLVNLLPQVVFETDISGNLTFANQYAFELFQYTEAEFERGINALDLIVPEAQENAATNIARVLAGEEIGGNEYVMQKKDGTTFPVILHSTRILQANEPVGLRGIIIDITERKKTEKELQVSEKKYRQIFEYAQTPNYEASLDGTILDVSPSVEKFLKYKREELIGTQILDLYAVPEQRDKLMGKLLETLEVHDEEVLVLDKDGEVHTSLISATFIEDEQKTVGSMMDISAWKKAEEDLRTSETIFRSVVESSPMGIHMYRLESDERLVFTGANPAADRILGVNNSEFIEKTIEEAFPPLINTEVPRRYRLAAKDGKRWHTEQIEYQDGRIQGAFEINAFQMVPGRMAVLFFDVTERKQAEQALKSSEERFRQLAENIKEIFWIVSPDWTKVYYVSPVFEDIWQVSKEDLYENAFLWLDAIVEEDRKKVYAYIQENQHGDLTEINIPEFRVRRPDGSEKWILARGFPVYDENGQAIRITGIAEDITERKKTQEIMVQTEKMMSIGGLAAGMAHEINNPLGAILQGTQNVIRRLSPDLETNLEPARESKIDLHNLQSYLENRGILSHLNGIQKAGKKASLIISNMLQFSRKSESTMAPTDLIALIENVLDMVGKDYDLEKMFDFRNTEVIREFDSTLPLVPCTETEIEQVILNLLNNASWAMAHQDGDIPPRITIRTKTEGDMARIEIEDNGPGMSEEIRKRIFEPFFTTKPVGEGTGLGLSVSYMIITNNHNGSMEVESETDRGARFIIRLPLNRKKV